MSFQKISGNFVELSVDNYIGTIRSGGTVSDLGFKTYRESNIGQAPVSGTGGSPGISLSLNTTAPLSSDADLRLVKDSANRQGEGFAFDFTIQNRHIAKVLQISFDIELINGTYTNPSTTQSGTFTVVSTSCTITANHSLIPGQSVYVTFPGGTSPISGQYVITSVVAGVSFTFTVASGSGTNVACTWRTRGSLRVYIIQNPTTSPIVIEPVNTDIQYGIANQKIKHIASFQTGAVGTSYRLIIHVGNNSTNAFTVDFANFKVWEPTQSVGSIITDWQNFTPTIGSSGSTAPSLGSGTVVKASWRRNGSNCEILFNLSQTSAGSAGSSDPYIISLPSGLSINSSTINITTAEAHNSVGSGMLRISDSSDAETTMMVQIHDANNLRFIYVGYSSGIRIYPWGGSGYSFGNSTLAVSFFASVPIQGWGSSVAMSSDSGDGRVVAAKYTAWVTQSLTGDVTRLRFSNINYDTHGAYSPSTGIYIAPIAGYYRYSFTGRFDHTPRIDEWVDNQRNTVLADYYPANGNYTFTNAVFLRAGQSLDFRASNSGNATGTGGGASAFTIERISAGSQVIASVEGVNLLYTTDSNTHNSSGNFIDLIYGNRVKDSHSAYNTTTGIFTAPMSGCYDIESFVYFVGNPSGYRQLSLTNSLNIIFFMGDSFNSSSSVSNQGSAFLSVKSYPMMAGQQVKLRYYQNSGGNLNLVNGAGSYSRLSIIRSGNY